MRTSPGGWTVATRESLRRIAVVALRELRERGRTKAFQLSTLLAVVAVVALVVLPSVLSGGMASYHVGVTGTVPPGTAPALTAQASAGGAHLEVTTYPTRAAGEQALRDRHLDVLLLDGRTLEWRQRPDGALAALVGSAARAVQVTQRATQLGLAPQDVATLLAPVPLTDRRLASTGGLGDRGQEVGLAAVVLVFLAITMYGNAVLTGVAQEKSNRVVEVLLARVRPPELLAGKVLGIGTLGLGQFAVVVGGAAVAARAVGAADAPQLPVSILAWLVLWFVLGYGFYSVVYAGLGALVSRVEDAGNVTAPVTTVLVAGYLATLAAMDSPDSTAATVLSFVPPTAPFVVPMRLALTEVPEWQSAVSALVMIAAIWLLVVVAARVYTGALLRADARVPLRLAWRSGRGAARDGRRERLLRSGPRPTPWNSE